MKYTSKRLASSLALRYDWRDETYREKKRWLYQIGYWWNGEIIQGVLLIDKYKNIRELVQG